MARSFNGTSDLIAVDSAHIAAQGTAFALCFWIKAVGSGSDVYVYGEGRTAAGSTLFGIHQGSSGKLNAFLRNDASSIRLNVTSANTQLDSTWHHFIYTQDASNNVAFFTDGANKETTSYTTSGTLTINKATIGALVRNTTGNWIPGTIAHFAIFGRNLSDKEAASLGAGLLPSHLGPTHYWPLWGTDSPEPDLVSAGVDGTLTGTTQATGGPPVGLSLLELAA